MPDIVILADTVRSPELRRELPLAMVDPGIFIERDGQRKVWVTGFELSRVAGFDDLEEFASRSSAWTSSRRRACRTRTPSTRS